MEIKYWNRVDGTKIALSEMSDQYIRNSINMLTRENSDYAELQSYKDLIEEIERRNKVEVEYMGSVELSKSLDELYVELRNQKKTVRNLENIIKEHLIDAKIVGFRMACEIMMKESGIK